MNTENKDVKGKGRQILGWALAVVGGLLIMVCGYYIVKYKIINFLIVYASFMWDGDFYTTSIFEWFLIILLLDIGISLLILGIRRITHKRKINRARIAGWILLIIGSPFLSFSLINFIGQIYDIVINQEHPNTERSWLITELVIGLSLVIVGIWPLLRREKQQSSDLGI